MARNGSGTYSLPAGNPVSTGATISSSTFNATLTDIASAITGSIAANGETPITGVIKFTAGSAAAPAISQTSDSNTGVYFPAADEFAVTVGGNQKLAFTATTATFADRVSANAGLTVAGGTLVTRGVTDNATATALTLSGSGANSVTIANSATTPAIGTTAGNLAVTAAIAATSTISAAGSIQCNNDDATPAGGGPGLGLFIGSSAIGIFIGSGIPSVAATDGSIYIRTDGSAGACIYQRRSSAWVATAA